ncbi:MAG: pyridoxal-phosphate dependent enzyme [Gammaproteobacteria bacterium]|nr:pyridoxal-phosphate dependent enzyme [Gammaproteobacteria bacterium]
MSKIIKSINKTVRAKTAKHFREHGVIVPTFKQLIHPETIPAEIKNKLKKIGLWDVNPLNLFRITWKNDIKTGLYGDVNYIEIPREITGVKPRVIGLIGKYFPTGAHKVGAAFGCLVPRIVSGEFDPTKHKAVWPSTGNYCRGGAFDSAIMGCTGIAILPEGMSKERFEWLKKIGAKVIATPGTESNVKEIYDKCNELARDPINFIFNQFAEFGNTIFHYNVTGRAIQEVFEKQLANKKSRLSAFISATGSAGTIASGDYLKKLHPQLKIVAAEALQCPTLLQNGFGEHRIEGIGDKHVPWIHNVRNTDAISAVNDDDCVRLVRLFNEKCGIDFLTSRGVKKEQLKNLSLLGISGICNLLSCIKTAKYYEMNEDDVIFTIFTDSMEMYSSRVAEYNKDQGKYSEVQAAEDFGAGLISQNIDHYAELSYYDRKRIHNLKYFTWIEQQGKESKELNAQWDPEYWRSIQEDEIDYFDKLITEFNKEVGLK